MSGLDLHFLYFKKNKQHRREKKLKVTALLFVFFIKYYKGLFMYSEEWRKYAKKRVFLTNVIRVSY